jgi:hypothetical protein
MFAWWAAAHTYRALSATDLRHGFEGLYTLVRASSWSWTPGAVWSLCSPTAVAFASNCQRRCKNPHSAG